MLGWGMSLFCLLWVPLLLFFWLSLVSKEKSGAVPFWALVLGTLAALIHYFAGYVIKASGFALSRWFFALIDIIIIPAVLPFLAWFLLSFFRQIDEKAEPAQFALLWFIPVSIACSIKWSVLRNPVFLILAPILWTAVALGVDFFIHIIRDHYSLWIIIPAAMGIAVIPCLAASSFWAFYAQKTLPGLLLLLVTAIPSGIVMGKAWLRRRE
ncbi:hypothetical protein AGMMS49991_02940 [Spirochaetia bacterium]|nr:hypothetical protein AGMMS49991_02940 [Spirochaetia bacterium]